MSERKMGISMEDLYNNRFKSPESTISGPIEFHEHITPNDIQTDDTAWIIPWIILRQTNNKHYILN